MNKAFDYNVCKNNNPDEFIRICKLIEQGISSLKKEKLLVDVDGSTIQVYEKNGNEIIVYDDYDIGAVYIEADMDLSEILNNIEISVA